MRTIDIKKPALRFLGIIPKKMYIRIREEISSLKDNPFPPNNKKLKNSDANYRIRVGDYRVLYSVESDKIIVHQIGHRKNIYL